jgi:hypothetical protein
MAFVQSLIFIIMNYEGGSVNRSQMEVKQLQWM